MIAVDHPSGEIRWISDPISGRISGTPAVGSNGLHIFLTRNTDDGAVGHFTLLQAEDGSLLFTESSADVYGNPTTPYAPLALVHNPVRGHFKEGEDNTNDLAVWGSSGEDGRGVKGFTRAFQLPSGFDGRVVDFRTSSIRGDTAWTTTSKPTLSPDGMNIFFAATKAEIRGWSDRRFGRIPNVKVSLPRQAVDKFQRE